MLEASTPVRDACTTINPAERSAVMAVTVCLSVALASCGAGQAGVHSRKVTPARRVTPTTRRASAPRTAARPTMPARAGLTPLPKPTNLAPLTGSSTAGAGVWRPVGRRVAGVPAVYETKLRAPGATQPAGIAWMDTHLLAARLYSGSESPGGGPYRYTAPIRPGSARRLVAAFNGGFKIKDAQGGYYTEGRVIDPLRPGAASLVVYANGPVNIGSWGRDVSMTPQVVAVRQNLTLLVADGRPTARATSSDWRAWGNTCGASSCAHSVPDVEHQWRSALGVTTNGALVYVQGPGLGPTQLADLLVRAGVVRGMELDINPDWPIFATYDPAGDQGLAMPSNGRLLTSTVRGPGVFFDPAWARDFITMSAR